MTGTILTGYGFKNAASEAPAENSTQQEQSQTEKALALINTFATGDTDTARSLLSGGYIQHNLARHRCGCFCRLCGISRSC